MAEVKLPEGWINVTLNEVAQDISYGYTASSTLNNVGPKFLRITDIQNNNVQWSDVPYCDISDEQLAKFKLVPNDLVFARTGATVGKSYLIKNNVPEAVFASYLIRVRCVSTEIIKYAYLFFQSANYWNQIMDFSSGIGQPNVNGSKLKQLIIPLPSLAEQKIIAERLDSLLAQVATIKTRLDAIPTLLKRFRQSVLSAAVSGKLTEEWRRNNGVIFESWFYEKAENVCLKVQSGSTPRDNPFDQDGTVPFLKVYNIVNQQIDFDYKPQFITEEVHSQKLKRSVALPDDVLMNIVGPPLGKVALLTNQYPEWNVNQAITIFRVDPKLLNSKYLYYVLCEGGLVREVVNDLKGIVGQINISLTQCRESIIPCPTIEEQTEIVRRVEKLFAYAESVGQQVAAAQSRVDKLTQAILAKAFSGELTADWRAAHPELISGEQSAAALLARIQAERAASAKPGRKPKRAIPSS